MTTARVRRVLVVCTANRCRSPMAERLIRARLEALGESVRIEVSSAGTWTEPGLPPTGLAIQAMAEIGIDITDVRSREIDAEMVRASDLVLAMTDSQRIAIETEFPEARGKVRLMGALAGTAYDVADPVAGELDDYRATRAELDRLVAAGWAEIVGAG